MLIQTDNPDLVRDTTTRALNPKRDALESFRKERTKQKRVDELEDKVALLETQVERLLALLGNK